MRQSGIVQVRSGGVWYGSSGSDGKGVDWSSKIRLGGVWYGSKGAAAKGRVWNV